MESIFYVQDNFITRLMQGTIDLANDPFYAVLVSGSHVPSTGEVQFSDISADEVTDLDYTRQALQNVQIVTVDAPKIGFTSDNISFGSPVSISAKYCYILRGDEAAPVATDPIVGWIDLANTGGTISGVTIAANGVVTFAGDEPVVGNSLIIDITDMPEVNRKNHVVSSVDTGVSFSIGDTTAASLVARTGVYTNLNDNTETSVAGGSFVVQVPTEGYWFTIG